MRRSTLSRVVVAVAALAVGATAPAAVPASAATPSGITRGQVLTAAGGVRTADDDYSPATKAALLSMITAQCGVTGAETIESFFGTATQAGGPTDGLLVHGTIGTATTTRWCEFGAVATVDPSSSLSGTSAVAGTMIDTRVPGDAGTQQTHAASLSGDVTATAPIHQTHALLSDGTTFTASGNVARTTTTRTTVKVAVPRTTSQLKAAKRTYEKRLKAAKKTYRKALAKAGSSTSKKRAATKTWKTRKAAAKARYRSDVAGFSLVDRFTSATEDRPFSLSATY